LQSLDPQAVGTVTAALIKHLSQPHLPMPITQGLCDDVFRAVSLRFRLLEQNLSATRAALVQSKAQLLRALNELQRVHHVALHDALTSLPNRNYFEQRLGRMLDAAEPSRHLCAVFYLDLDGFKALNDTHGHETGDELLRIVGARLARLVRAEDFVSRIGGDEFACLLTDLTSRDQLRLRAQMFFEAISAPAKIGTLELRVAPSVGISIYPSDGVSLDALLRNADTAMYRAKRLKAGYAFFDECRVDPDAAAVALKLGNQDALVIP
jgi:diguanylate cyclase (GGDEF)-like protein